MLVLYPPLDGLLAEIRGKEFRICSPCLVLAKKIRRVPEGKVLVKLRQSIGQAPFWVQMSAQDYARHVQKQGSVQH